MKPVPFLFGLLRQTAVPIEGIESLESKAREDYGDLLNKGNESKHKPVRLAAEYAEKWYVQVILAFAYIFVGKWLMEKITGTPKASKSEDIEDDDDLFLDDLDDDDDDEHE